MDAGTIAGIVVGIVGIVASAGFGIWAIRDAREQARVAIDDAREQVRGLIRTERNLAWTRIQNEMAWLFVDPTDKSHTKEIATGLGLFALLEQELDPNKKPETLKEAAENEALDLAERLVADGYATWKQNLDMEKVRHRLDEWRAEKDKARAQLAESQKSGQKSPNEKQEADMRDAARLMAKVFAAVFGAGIALVVLLYLLLGGYYLYGRIERVSKLASETTSMATAASVPSVPPGFVPDAQLDCRTTKPHGPWEEYCSVLIGRKVVAFISREEVKSNLAGWMTWSPSDKTPK